MKHMLFALFSFIWVCCLPINTAAADSEQAYIIDIDGIISPATADYFTRSLEKAIDANAALFWCVWIPPADWIYQCAG